MKTVMVIATFFICTNLFGQEKATFCSVNWSGDLYEKETHLLIYDTDILFLHEPQAWVQQIESVFERYDNAGRTLTEYTTQDANFFIYRDHNRIIKAVIHAGDTTRITLQ